MTTKELIAKVLELDAKATKGPWQPGIGHRSDPGYYDAEFGMGPEKAAYWEPGSTGKRIYPSAKPDAELISYYRTAAPTLARMLQRAIEQRDHYHAVCYRDLEPALEDESLRKRNAELDRIAKEEG